MLSCRGFTLVEMSVVLIIIGMLILTVFPALTALRSANQRSLTQGNLQSLMQATAAFVQANGCLPCPTPATTTGNGFGRVRGDTVVALCNGCPTAEGIPPYISLGISSSVAGDGWGHWYTMRVDPALTSATLGTVIPPTTTCTTSDAASNSTCVVGTNRKGLCQPSLKSTSSFTAVQITTPGGSAQPAAVIFVSHGSKGYGAFLADAIASLINSSNGSRLPFPANAPACPANPSTVLSYGGLAASECNATGNNTFVNSMTMDGYDDMMAYVSRDVIVSMLNNGACN